MPQTIFTLTNSRLQPAEYPSDARKYNGKFGASKVFQTGAVIGRKTSDGLLYPALSINDIQVWTQTGTATAGTLTISVMKANGTIGITTALAYNISLAALQTALDVASGTVNGIVATSVGSAAPFSNPAVLTFTYSGTGFSGLQQPLATADISLLTGTQALVAVNTPPNRVQTITVNIAATAGTFNIGIKRPTGVVGYTGPVAYNASLATWQTALDLASGVANGVVGSSAGSAAPFSSATALILTFSGTGYAGLPQDLVLFNIGTDVTGTTRVTVDDTTATRDGTDVAVGFCEFGFQTDANSLCYLNTTSTTADMLAVGVATMPYYVGGDFNTVDLIGWNPYMLKQLSAIMRTTAIVHIP